MKRTGITILAVFILAVGALGCLTPMQVMAAPVPRFSVQSPDAFSFGSAVETELVFTKGFQFAGKVACSMDDGATWFSLPSSKVYIDKVQNKTTLRQDGPLAAVGKYQLRFSSAKKDGTGIQEHSVEVQVLPPSMNAIKDVVTKVGEEVSEIKFCTTSPFVTGYKWAVQGGEGQAPAFGKEAVFPAFAAQNNTGEDIVIVVRVTPYVRMVAGEPQEFTITVQA